MPSAATRAVALAIRSRSSAELPLRHVRLEGTVLHARQA
jgi:hypothetical protein